MSLGALYPSLRFAYAADKFIEISTPSDIVRQLINRRITRINISLNLNKTFRLGIGSDDSFEAFLCKSNAPERWAKDLGLIVARTFQFNLCNRPPTDLLRLGDRADATAFGVDFSQLWLAKVTEKAVIEFIEQSHK